MKLKEGQEYGYYYPADPECPATKAARARIENDVRDGRVSVPTGILRMETWEQKHRHVCERCREYGLQNKAVQGGGVPGDL